MLCMGALVAARGQSGWPACAPQPRSAAHQEAQKEVGLVDFPSGEITGFTSTVRDPKILSQRTTRSAGVRAKTLVGATVCPLLGGENFCGKIG